MSNYRIPEHPNTEPPEPNKSCPCCHAPNTVFDPYDQICEDCAGLIKDYEALVEEKENLQDDLHNLEKRCEEFHQQIYDWGASDVEHLLRFKNHT